MKQNTLLAILIVIILAVTSIRAQITAFNFQGRLNDGSSPANGRYDLQFKLFDAVTGGNQISGTVDRANLMLVNGVFSTPLDFGAAAFNNGERFLEIAVRPAGSPNAHVILGGRQQLLAVPFAVRAGSSALADLATNAQHAANADNATNAQNAVNATNAVNAVSATTAQNSLSLGGLPANNYARLNFANPGLMAAANLSTPGNISVGGNTLQPGGSNGLVKAMVVVNFAGTIEHCYNGVTGVATGTCGINAVRGDVGQYELTFDFQVSNRFVLVSVQNRTSVCNGSQKVIGLDNNYGINYYQQNTLSIQVKTFLTGEQVTGIDSCFTLMVF